MLDARGEVRHNFRDNGWDRRPRILVFRPWCSGLASRMLPRMLPRQSSVIMCARLRTRLLSASSFISAIFLMQTNAPGYPIGLRQVALQEATIGRNSLPCWKISLKTDRQSRRLATNCRECGWESRSISQTICRISSSNSLSVMVLDGPTGQR